MKHVEIVVDARPSQQVRRNLDAYAQCIGGRLLPLAGVLLGDITTRYSDSNEIAHMSNAQTSSGLNTYSYLAAQHQDRQSHRVSPDMLSILITPQALVSIQPNGRIVARNSFGHSIEDYHEAIVSTARYTSELRQKTDICNAIGFTAIHELGHLLGLVPEYAKRSAPGKHCRNRCVMQSPSNVKNAVQTNSQLPHNNFCAGCLRYVQQTN